MLPLDHLPFPCADLERAGRQVALRLRVAALAAVVDALLAAAWGARRKTPPSSCPGAPKSAARWSLSPSDYTRRML
jgi:hypothetical protein